MKKLITCVAVATLSISAFANEKLATSELKAMDCATLSVEKSNAKRDIETADKNIANINTQAPAKTVSKWAGLASSALGAFGGQSETAAKASSIAADVAGTENTSDSSNLSVQQQNKTNAQANMDNISIYQKAKKCKM